MQDDPLAALRAKINNKQSNRAEEDDPMAALRAKILGRGKERHTSMVDMLAAKYGGGGNNKSKGRKKDRESSVRSLL